MFDFTAWKHSILTPVEQIDEDELVSMRSDQRFDLNGLGKMLRQIEADISESAKRGV